MDKTNSQPAQPEQPLDLVIIGSGIGGVIALYYARKAGLNVRLLERQKVAGGLWAELPPWQDIQFGRLDWTLGDLPIAGEDQASIRDNIQAWVARYGLADFIRFDTDVTMARRDGDHWALDTSAGPVRARHLIAATGAHNRAFIPPTPRESVALRELHSSQLRDPKELRGQRVLVVGGGASGYDLLDLCFQHEARQVVWVYRNTRWMMPTLKPKSETGGPRGLAQLQMNGANDAQINAFLQPKMDAGYAKYGLQDILPEEPFDIGRHQLIPGRRRMIENFQAIQRHRGTVEHIRGKTVKLSDGASVDADVVLWGTGYEIDLSYFSNAALSCIRTHDQLSAQCGCGVLALAEPGLYFMAAALEGTGTAPLTYALLARTIASHIQGHAVLERVATEKKINHFEYARFLAARDPASFPATCWEAEYRRLANEHPGDRPLPIPV
jgi:hypothetical protein